jgi:hypothetical protein
VLPGNINNQHIGKAVVDILDQLATILFGYRIVVDDDEAHVASSHDLANSVPVIMIFDQPGAAMVATS